ncbi:MULTISPECIES: acyl-CoA carboxylase epsilon subunit [unclassified Streptomyces]|uniref:acyl-CoA carboxylase epsilon subunit n=1 Tax=Streptomyces sp. NPDC127532 TaxID=3345399 RepID=UPI0036399043
MSGQPLGAPPHEVLRVEKGAPNAEELAALTAVLLARAEAARGGGPAGAAHTTRPGGGARWRRPERALPFADPRTWRGATD